MQLPSTFATYVYAGITFYRPLQSGEFAPWFFPETEYTADPVLGGTQVYLDFGGDSVAPLAMRALAKSASDRQTLRLARRSTGTLTNSRGRTATASLVKASPVDSDDYRWFYIDLTFIYRPS
jgi:hypothetical protein